MGQMSRSQREVTGAKISYLAGNCRFRSNLVQTLITWHLMYYKCSRSVRHRSRSQH